MASFPFSGAGLLNQKVVTAAAATRNTSSKAIPAAGSAGWTRMPWIRNLSVTYGKSYFPGPQFTILVNLKRIFD